MLTSFLAIASATFIFLFSLQPCLAENDLPLTNTDNSNLDLPSALPEDLFDDLPFEQRRQALREEVEMGPRRPSSFQSPQKYNLLIR